LAKSRQGFGVLMLAAVFLLGCIGGLLTGLTWQQKERANGKYALADALPHYSRGSCADPTAAELKKFENIVDALELFANQFSPMTIGAMKSAAHGIYRTDGSHLRVCPPDDFFARIGDTLARSPKLYSGHRLAEYELALFAQLPVHHPAIVEEVAKAAFAPEPQLGEVFREADIRPAARVTLAIMGPAARAYSDKTWDEMSSADSMGTSAAQISVATGHPGALARIASLAQAELDKVPSDKVIPWNTKNRLYELAYALTLGGEEARDHLAPFREMLSRKVESFAPPFGMLEFEPERLCFLLRPLDGGKSEPIANHPACRDTDPLDQ
jgi:hypothetical protein